MFNSIPYRSKGIICSISKSTICSTLSLLFQEQNYSKLSLSNIQPRQILDCQYFTFINPNMILHINKIHLSGILCRVCSCVIRVIKAGANPRKPRSISFYANTLTLIITIPHSSHQPIDVSITYHTLIYYDKGTQGASPLALLTL